jgi:DNA segregation ATPase FtsK/SpoIIIE, S-DNA-T family
LDWSDPVKITKNIKLADDLNARLVWGISLMLGSMTGLVNIFFGVDNLNSIEQGGGLIGYIFYPVILGNFGLIGGLIMLISTGLFGFFLLSQLTFSQFIDTIQDSLTNPSKVWELIPDIFEAWKHNGVPTSEIPESLEDEKKTIGSTKTRPINDQSKTPASPVIDSQKTRKQSMHSSDYNWKLPRFDMLKENFTKSEPGDVEGNKKAIQDTLGNFGIQVEMADVVTGPTVTQYTLRPASGVKLSSIDSLQRDLALTLAASSMRLEAPIPGKSLVGIEIPNKIKSVVRLRDVIQTKKFTQFDQPLPVPLGTDVAGNSLIRSITKTPHLLVAGATGSGKSVWINSMLVSLLYRYTPGELEMILMDMKRVELKLYDHIPHLLAPVITDAEKAINALKWAVLEMDRRYRILEEYGKRNLEDYNEFALTTKIGELETIAYVVIVIDELGDLMIMAKNEVEPIIVRLTQMSRAVGIHLVLGTQRPDTQVVTGLIKANVPSRIAFTVASQVDSRVILDQGGAEKLLGQGDGLFMSASTIKPVRFQSCLVEENEIRKVVNFWREQAQTNNSVTNLRPEVTESPKTKLVVPGLIDSREDENEDMYHKIQKFVIAKQAASTSMLQTAFGIGYPKARKMIEMLEEDGIVGPTNGSKPREVLVENID